MEKTVFENWITSEEQASVNLNEYDFVIPTNAENQNQYLIEFKNDDSQSNLFWLFDLRIERDTAYKNIQKLMVNIDFK